MARYPRRIALACTVGTTVEFYDFYIYGAAAALTFPDVFFPELSPAMATTASMSAFAAAFVSRPLGGAVFGHFGDRLGRKAALVATMLIMGVATVAVGLTPSAASIGVAAPLIVLALRLLQGFAVGGEWAGSALLAAEYAPTTMRGRYGMFTALGAGIAMLLTSLTFLAVNLTIGESSSAFASWGWRVPFLFSGLLIAVALYVRLNIAETPVFAHQQARGTIRAPLAEVLRGQPGAVALASGSFVAVFAFVFMAGTYLMTYAHSRLGLSRTVILCAGALGGLVWIAVVPVSATISDRVGRRPVVLFGWTLGLAWAFALIPLVSKHNSVLFTVAIVGTYAIAALAYAPMTSFVPELFATRNRYTGAGLALNISGIAGGAVPPLLAGALSTRFGAWAIGLMMASLAAISLVCTFLLPETKGRSLVDSEPSHPTRA